MTQKIKYTWLLLIIFTALSGLQVLTAQSPKLSLQEAVEIGLKENLSLQVAENQIEIAKVNSGPGAAGMLPSVTASGDLNYSLSNANQRFLDGRENKTTAGSDIRAGAEVRLDWTIFDGKAMFIRRDQLAQKKELSVLALQAEAQTIAANITTSYQDLVRQSAIIKIFEEQITYLSDLLTLTKAKLEIGSATQLDVLQAQTDLNELINAKELAEMSYKLARADLNQALNRGADTAFTPDTSFLKPVTILSFEGWKAKAQQTNADIKYAQQAYEIVLKDRLLAETEKLPQIDLNSGINYGYLNSNTGFLSSNTSYGPYIGLTGRYNLYDGHRVKREIQLAELDAINASLAIDEISRSTENELFIAYQNYEYFVAQEKIERENLALAKATFALADELYRVGKINQFELRQVRIQRLDIQRRLVQAAYQQAISYLRLMELSGLSWL